MLRRCTIVGFLGCWLRLIDAEPERGTAARSGGKDGNASLDGTGTDCKGTGTCGDVQVLKDGTFPTLSDMPLMSARDIFSR